jgi:rsbT antagonist protein RsbS
MSVLILEQGQFLIASIQSSLRDAELLQLQEDLVAQVGKVHARGVVTDVTPLDVMDSFASRTLSTIAQVLRLRGAQTVIVGIQPDVAFTIVQLGLTLDSVETSLDLEEGIHLLGELDNRSRDVAR